MNIRLRHLKHTPVTIRLLHRTIRFLLSLLAACIILFLVGNWQDFLDESQFVILNVQIFTGSLLFLVAAGAFLFELYQICILGRKKYTVLCSISFFVSLIGLCVLVVSIIILILSSGTGKM